MLVDNSMSGDQNDLGSNTVLPVSFCVTLGELLNLSKPQSTHLENEEDGPEVVFPLPS